MKLEEFDDKATAVIKEIMDPTINKLEAEWGHRVHMLVVVIPMTQSMEAEGFTIVGSFGGDPGALCEVADHITMAALQNMENPNVNPH